MEMSYGGAMVLPRNYVVMDQEEMTYVEGGFSLNEALDWLGSNLLDGFVFSVFMWACKKVGAWAALNAAGIIAIGSRVVAIAVLAGIVAVYGVMIYNTYKTAMK